MKVIDLLNKIANGEDVPKKIKWEDTIYIYSEFDKDYLEYPFSDEEYNGLFNMKDSILTQYLNDEVEIIEEEKKIPEKLNYKKKDMTSINGFLLQYCVDFAIKIDEIIDYLDYLKSKGDE